MTMSEGWAVAQMIAGRYREQDRASKSVIVDELCATAGWYRDHALRIKLVRPATPRSTENECASLKWPRPELSTPKVHGINHGELGGPSPSLHPRVVSHLGREAPRCHARRGSGGILVSWT